jgi:hypothetical protein
MKKKFREIVVDGITYGWTVKEDCGCDSNDKYIKIWLDKKVIYESTVNGDMEITPKMIREWILIKGGKTIQELEKELTDLRKENLEAWKIYGSELCAGDMLSKEKNLEIQIENIKELVK